MITKKIYPYVDPVAEKNSILFFLLKNQKSEFMPKPENSFVYSTEIINVSMRELTIY